MKYQHAHGQQQQRQGEIGKLGEVFDIHGFGYHGLLLLLLPAFYHSTEICVYRLLDQSNNNNFNPL
jgi:hypothetical protein